MPENPGADAAGSRADNPKPSDVFIAKLFDTYLLGDLNQLRITAYAAMIRGKSTFGELSICRP